MAISNFTPRVQLLADGSTGPFPFQFKIFEDTDIRVFDGAALRVLGADYTVEFDFDDPDAQSGSVNWIAGRQPPGGSVITIDRRVVSARAEDFQQAGPPIQGPLNVGLDRLWAKIQEINDQFLRLVRLADTTVFTGDVILPEPEADRIIGWNDDGSGLENVDVRDFGSAILPLSLINGGTGGSFLSLAALRAGLGLEIGVDVEAFDAAIAKTNQIQEWIRQQNFDAVETDSLGPDLVVNGTFDADTDWDKGPGWTIAGGVAQVDGSQIGDTLLTQDVAVVLGAEYELSFEIVAFTAGGIIPNLGGVPGTARNAVGVYREFFVPTSITAPRLILQADSLADLQIDNVSVRISNLAWDLDLEQVKIITLVGGGAPVLPAPTNQKAGATYLLIIKQDAIGGRSITFDPAYKFQSGDQPVLTATPNGIDMISFASDGVNMLGVPLFDFQ